MEKWQIRLQANKDATERWTRKLLRAATELQKLRKEHKRLIADPKGRKLRKSSLEEIEIRMAAGGSEFNDEIPL